MRQKGGIPYQPIEYLESTGTQAILTDYYPNPKTKIIADVYFAELLNGNAGSNSNFFGVNDGSSIFSFNNGNGNYNNLYLWNNTADNNIQYLHFSDLTISRSEMTITNSSFSFLGVNKQLVSKTTTQSLPMAIFGVNTIEKLKPYKTFRFRIFSFKIYEDDVLVRNYIPVRIGDEGYLLDTISGNLFCNIGTGQFILGQDI
jgi:hypothetical protein